MATMRAKMVINAVSVSTGSEALSFRAVCKSDGYGPDGTDENNTFATWTPMASLSMTVSNPNLLGKFKVGDTFYIDFTPAE